MIFILDACALIAFLGEERGKGFEAVDALFARTDEEDITIFISIINLTEVLYHFIRDLGEDAASELLNNVGELPLTVIRTITDDVYRGAARLKTRCSMSLGDTFLCGTAKSIGAAIVTKDGEIRKAEGPEALSVLWINQ
jgi:predicted nucleic acid-binding protein